MKKAVVFIKGGFGNQLFQFAFANYLKINNFEVTVNTDLFKGNRTSTPRELTIPISNFGFKEQNIISKQILKSGMIFESSKKIRNSKMHLLFKDYKYTKNNQDILTTDAKSLFFNDYWKDMKYVDTSKDYIINSLKKNKIIHSGFIENNDFAMIHVRRGDFVKDDRHLNVDFYEKGLQIIKNKNINLKYDIFTNDYDWVSQQSIFQDAENIFRQKSGKNNNQKIDGIDGMDDKDETIKTFSSMLRYKHFIAGNSSFAFWAAYLKSTEDSIVVVPNPWFRNHPHSILKKDKWYVVENA
jgi:hypothetical protein